MELRQLGYVIAVADHGGFTRAAEELGHSQPAVSQAVRALETELGVVLFHRAGRQVVLTAAGEALLGPARQALRDVATAQAAVAEVAGLTAGRLDVVCLPTLAVVPTAELIGRFRRAHPGVVVRLVEPEDADAVADHIRSGTSEIGLTELPVAGADLVTHELERQDFVAVLPGDHVDAGPTAPLSLARLARLPLVTTPAGTSTRRQIDEAFADSGLIPDVAVETDHREVIVALVLAGAGISILPRPMGVAAIGRGAALREIRPRITRRIGLVHRPGLVSPAARAFLAVALPELAPPSSRPPARRR